MAVAKAKKVSYLGNINLKPLGYQHQWNIFEAQEYAKCAEDPLYFIKNFVYITSLDHGSVKFALHPFQERIILAIHNNRNTAVLTARQQGKTTCSAAYLLWYTLFQEKKTVAILANKAAAAREIMSRYQEMYELLPIWLQQGIKEWNKGNVELENGSKAFTSATSKNAVRGKSCNVVYVDETAFVPNNLAEEFFTALYPTISSGKDTKVIITSTPCGMNHFWKMWTEAEQGINSFVPVRVHYWETPGRDEAWAESQRKLLGELKYNQEVLCEFLGSSLTLIRGDVLSKMSPIRPSASKDNLDISESPKKDGSYVLVADTSRGVKGDSSAFTVLDTAQAPYKIVAKYKNNEIAPMLYPSIIHQVAKNYNNALVLVEINDIGGQVADILWNEFEYENILFISKEKGGQRLSAGFSRNSQVGIRTDKQVKRIGCSNLKSLIEENKLLITDADIISELSTFIETKTGYFAADEGYHDDLVMCLVLFAWLSDQQYFKEMTNSNLRQSLYESQMENIEQGLTPFGVVCDGSDNDEDKYELIGGELWELVGDHVDWWVD